MANRIIERAQLREMLRRREFSPVYLLFGAETYLRNMAAKTIAEFALEQPELREFNLNEVSLNSCELVDALAAAEQMPFGSAKRVVLIRDFFVSTNKQVSSLKGNAEETLVAYLSNPAPSSIVIIVADEFDKRLKAAKVLQEKALTVEFKSLSEEDAYSFAKAKFEDADAEAEPAAVKLLVELVGVDAGKLSIETAKLATAALPSKKITAEIVRKFVINSRVLPNFDLTGYLVAGSKKEALETMSKIFDDGAEPLMILGLLSYNFRQLCMTKDYMDQGLSQSEIRKRVRMGRYPDQVFAAARRAPSGRLEHIVKRLAETDLAIKTSVAPPRLQVEMLVCELALGK